MTPLVAVDLGGTRIRFALAEVHAGRVGALGEASVYECSQFPDFLAACARFADSLTSPLPTNMALAVAGAVREGPFTLTNLSWIIDRALFTQKLGLERLVLLNDFVAIGHAAATLDPTHFLQIAGPPKPVQAARVITVVGPGTGLGVAQVVRSAHGYEVVHSEGGHVGFAPADATENAVLALARGRHARVSAERLLSGPGLMTFFEALSGRGGPFESDSALWTAALDGDDAQARCALDHYCAALGRFAGDMALAHGADAVVVAGGLGQRIFATSLGASFANGFRDKGRFCARMDAISVSLISHAQPGLQGVAAAFSQEICL